MSFAMYLVLFTLLLLQIQPLDAAPAADDPQPPVTRSNATIDKITKETYDILTSSGRLGLTNIGASSYIPDTSVDIIKNPCWSYFLSWYAANYWYFQCLANMLCRPYRGAFSNKCICVLFQVNPQYPPCKIWSPWIYAASIKAPEYLTIQPITDGK